MGLEPQLFADKAAAIERHLRRVESRLPAEASLFAPNTDASDAVILHLWQAIQATIDLAAAACVRLSLGSPTTYADAFVRLAEGDYLDTKLAARLRRAAGFRNLLVHAYESLDMQIVFQAATHGPGDVRAFVSAAAGWVDTAP
ncbi:MAG: DUF86 domain-containing protein [Myxococcota bacterium]